MRVVVAGGSGFLGQALVGALTARGDAVVCLSRSGEAVGNPWRPGRVTTVRWTARSDPSGWGVVVDGADAVVNLAGESIAARRWSEAQKARLRSSRLDTTTALGAAITAAQAPPALLLNASAVGIYGDRGDEVLTEASPPGTDFLADLGVAWERAAIEAGGTRTRVACLRTSLVLAARGGALQKMLLPFKLGLGGSLGPGTQYMPWVHLDDWVALVTWILDRQLDGPFNVTAPHPVTNTGFARALGRALRRPAVLPAPGFALKLLLGEMADALLLSGQRAVPARALELGFVFRHETIDGALEDLLRH